MGAARPRVVVIGGGFGGLEAVKALKNADVDITLLDRRNHHLFQPLLYQVATAALNPSDIATPLRSVLRKQKNVEVFLAEAQRIDTDARKVMLTDGELPYDYLVVATGATHSYFGRDDWEQHAPGLKTIEDALEIRRRVLYAYEAAERETNPATRHAWMTFVIVGAGATGAELAGAFAEISRRTLARDFRHIDPREARILLVEHAPHVLPAFTPELSEKARAQLTHLGVEIRTGTKVTGIDDDGVDLGDERVPSRTVIWAAGVRASPLVQSLNVPLDRAGRVVVEPDLSIPAHPEVMVVGDVASLQQDGKPVFGVAPAAMQAGKHSASNIRRMIAKEPPQPFRYVDKGSLATLGRKAGIADIRGLHLSGFIAWAAWLLIHVFFLIGFRNRVLVLLEWAWSYLTFQRGARLITGAAPKTLEETPKTIPPPVRSTTSREAAPVSVAQGALSTRPTSR
jgi:NADH dehydrogenase